MVHASTFVLAAAACAVAPALAAPAGQHQAHRAGGAGLHHPAPAVATAAAAPSPAAELEAREPKFNFKKAFRGVAKVAKTATSVGMKVAPLLLRDVEDLDELDARDFEVDDAELMEREPKFNFKKAFRGVAKIAKTATSVGMKVAPLLLRDEEGNIYDTRDFEELQEIDERDPFNWGKAFRGVARVAKTAGGIALKAAPLLLREVDDLEELDARDFLDEDSEDLIYVRDDDGELYVLDARRFNLGKALHKVSNIAHKAVNIGNKVMGVASQFGYRDLEDVEERDFEEERNEVREEASLDELD